MVDYYADPCIELTGGGDGALDAIDGATVSDKCFAVVVTNSFAYLYQLDEDSAAAESSPLIIKPDSNAGDKRWILRETYAPSKINYVDRGDQGAFKTQADITADDTWKTNGIDLSSILPSGTKAVIIEVQVSDDTVGNYFQLRVPGRTNIEFSVNTQVANVALYHGPVVLACGSTRKFDYRGKSDFTILNLWVHGYFI